MLSHTRLELRGLKFRLAAFITVFQNRISAYLYGRLDTPRQILLTDLVSDIEHPHFAISARKIPPFDVILSRPHKTDNTNIFFSNKTVHSVISFRQR
jgi:hypothetical protein